MHLYASGKGHCDLAKELGIQVAVDLSQSGCNNTRIIRTTLKDSFLTDQKTFYVLGMTFIVRNEIPILKLNNGEDELTSFEGRWTNPQNQIFNRRWEHFWTQKDTDLYVDLMFKESTYSVIDKTENLMLQLVALIESLTLRGHKVLIYQQADQSYFMHLHSDRLNLFKKYKNFVGDFAWNAVQWQYSQGVPQQPGDYINRYGDTPVEMRHRKGGEHHKLNEYLINYIKEYNILQ